MGNREIKKNILKLLQDESFDKSLEKIRQMPERQAVNPLFSFFFNTNELIKWRSITAMGVVVSQLADHDMESARVVMRRLMWNLNDESGGIGWGSAEAMGEIMARHGRVGEEYAHLLLSYMKYYNKTRTHLSLNKDAPLSRAIQTVGRIFCLPILGGLHHHYVRI